MRRSPILIPLGCGNRCMYQERKSEHETEKQGMRFGERCHSGKSN